MTNFFQNIKDKLFPKPDFDLEDDDELENNQGEEEEEIEDDVEVDLSGPEVASAKKNKMIVIVASSLLITLVIYFLFLKESDAPKEQLETVAPVFRAQDVARSDDGKSPFEIDVKDSAKEVEVKKVLNRPKQPEIPKLPEIAQEGDEDGLILPDDLFIEEPIQEELKEKEKKVENVEPEKLAPEIKREQAAVLPIQVLPSNNIAQSGNNAQPTFSDPRYAPIIVLQGASGPSNSVGLSNNIKVLNGDPIQNLQKSATGVQASFVDDRANVVAQGKLLTAVLETAINTEIQGSVRAIISRDVYGEAGSDVLIPRGSRLYGSYSTDTARGRARIQINWTRVIRPDGVDLNISSFASDQFGRAGIEGVIDNKYSEFITNSILTSIFAVAGAAFADGLIDNNQNTTTVDPNNGTSTITSNATTQAVTDVARNVTDAASRFTREYFDARPTITVPQGTRITVLVNQDIKMPPVKR